MTRKLVFLLGFGAGYVLGARAGRERYREIAAKARSVWKDPRVQERAGQAQQFAAHKAAEAGTKVAEKAGDAGAKVVGAVSDKVREKTGSTDVPTSPAISTSGYNKTLADETGPAVEGRS